MCKNTDLDMKTDMSTMMRGKKTQRDKSRMQLEVKSKGTVQQG